MSTTALPSLNGNTKPTILRILLIVSYSILLLIQVPFPLTQTQIGKFLSSKKIFKALNLYSPSTTFNFYVDINLYNVVIDGRTFSKFACNVSYNSLPPAKYKNTEN